MKDIHLQVCTSSNEVQDVIYDWVPELYNSESLEVPIVCELEEGTLISFWRQRTDDSSRTQYDLHANVLDSNGTTCLYLVAANLYAAQCEMRINEIISNQRIK